MKETILNDLVTHFGKPIRQMMEWLLRYWDSHVEKQRELFNNNIQIGWSEENLKCEDLMAYTKPLNEAAASQSAQLKRDHALLDTASLLITCPEDAANVLSERTQDGNVRCRYFTRVGHVREVICTCEGRPRRSRGYRVQLRGARNPLSRPICDKCLGALSRDPKYLAEVYKRGRFKPRNKKTDHKKRTEWTQKKERPIQRQVVDEVRVNHWDSTVVELRALCRNKGIPVSGTKGELVARLSEVKS